MMRIDTNTHKVDSITQATTPEAAFKRLAALGIVALLSACSSMPQLTSMKEYSAQAAAPATEALAAPRERPELLLGATAANTLVSFKAGAPGQVLSEVALKGLQAGEQIIGMDFRVAKGQLYALTSAGRLLRIDPNSGESTAIGAGVSLPAGQQWGVDFNPTVDRIRVVNETGSNLRLHPDTGAQVDGDAKTDGLQSDGPLAYAKADLLAGSTPRVTAAGYTYNATNEKITTNYVIDAGAAYLSVQGSVEGAAVVVSPNTGLLQSVGPLMIERFDDASLDITDTNNTAYLVTSKQGGTESRLYEVSLGSGQARLIGAVGAGKLLRAFAIAP